MMGGQSASYGWEDLNTTEILNVAEVCPSTQALGPGTRAVIWVQGCTLNCPGCIAPNWIPIRPAHLVNPMRLVEELLQNPNITGLTFSGGEPMLQAQGLAILARHARTIRNINIICFTGFRMEQLMRYPPVPNVQDLLNEVDLLIDGPYIASNNNNLGLRGSTNQRVHYLSDRLRGFDFEGNHRTAEIFISDGQAFLVGIPSVSVSRAFIGAVNRLHPSLPAGKVYHERV